MKMVYWPSVYCFISSVVVLIKCLGFVKIETKKNWFKAKHLFGRKIPEEQKGDLKKKIIYLLPVAFSQQTCKTVCW